MKTSLFALTCALPPHRPLCGRAYAEALVLQGEYAPDPSIKGGTLATTSAPVGEMMSEMFAPVAGMFRAMAKA